jgi:predicted Holliday junction resolvase-like endonuclease
MTRLFILVTVVFLLALFVRELRKYFTRDQKEEELRDTFIEGDLADMELEIAEEKARQEDIRTETEELKSESNNNDKEDK